MRKGIKVFGVTPKKLRAIMARYDRNPHTLRLKQMKVVDRVMHGMSEDICPGDGLSYPEYS